jgi:hypothetical protein
MRNYRAKIALIGMTVILMGAALSTASPSRSAFANANAAADETEAMIPLAELTGEQDHATLEFSSVGCFHASAFRLEYTPLPTPRLTVFNVRTTNGIPQRLATVTLTPEQVARLDQTRRYFRGQKLSGDCTTTDGLKVTISRGTSQTVSENNRDDSCGRRLREEADPGDLQALRGYPEGKRFPQNVVPILSLDRVVFAAKSANQRGIAIVPLPDIPRTETQAYRSLLWQQKAATGKSGDKT